MNAKNNRRQFLSDAATATAGSAIVASSLLASAAEADPVESSRRVVIGVMGLNRGLALAREFAGHENVEVRYLCDVDKTRCEAAQKRMANSTEHDAKIVHDFRRILDDDEVDALICAAPNHWHGPATILACTAGKHVYVEKPCSHTPEEGEWMVAAARKHHRVVQVGMQRRSNPAWIEVINRLHQGAIGEVYLARSWYSNLRQSIGNDNLVAVPAYLDHELWQGPAPRRPYSSAVVHYNWHWRWHWGNGELGNNGIHTLDLCRWGLQAELPTQVASVGGRYAFDDVQETPDTQTVAYEFGGQKSATWQSTSCNQHQRGFVTFYGTEGTVEVDENGTNRQFDRHDKLVKETSSSSGSLREHVANFLSCVRIEDATSLNAEVEVGHQSTLLCHLGNIAHRVGQQLNCDHEGHILDAPEAMKLWGREYQSGWKPVV